MIPFSTSQCQQHQYNESDNWLLSAPHFEVIKICQTKAVAAKSNKSVWRRAADVTAENRLSIQGRCCMITLEETSLKGVFPVLRRTHTPFHTMQEWCQNKVRWVRMRLKFGQVGASLVHRCAWATDKTVGGGRGSRTLDGRCLIWNLRFAHALNLSKKVLLTFTVNCMLYHVSSLREWGFVKAILPLTGKDNHLNGWHVGFIWSRC